MVGQRTDTVVNPGRTYVSGGSPYYPSHYRDHWHDYYRQSYDRHDLQVGTVHRLDEPRGKVQRVAPGHAEQADVGAFQKAVQELAKRRPEHRVQSEIIPAHRGDRCRVQPELRA